MTRCSTSIQGNTNEKPQWYHFTHTRPAVIKKIIKGVGEDAEKLEPSYVDWRNVT